MAGIIFSFKKVFDQEEFIMLSLETTIIIPKDVLFRAVSDKAGGGMVLLNLAEGKYFTLDDVGSRMWQLMSEHRQLKAAHQALLQEYEVEPEQLEKDLLELTNRLVDHGLLQVSDS
jgi:Coenzyme PQQ synthesis protein D (PqqD)